VASNAIALFAVAIFRKRNSKTSGTETEFLEYYQGNVH